MADERLNLTEEEVLKALESEFTVEFMQPGDLTTAMVAERFNVGLCCARRRMQDLIKAGMFSEHKVRKVDDRRIVTVYRKVK